MIQRFCRPLLQALALSLATSVVMMTIYYGLSFISTLVPNELIRASISEAFADEELQHESWFFAGSPLARHLGPDQYTDCLALHIALNNQFGDKFSVVSQTIFAHGRRPCIDLQEALTHSSDSPAAERWRYDRYMQGTGILLRYLLPMISIGDLRWILRGFFIIVIIFGLGFHFRKIKGNNTLVFLLSGHFACIVVLVCLAAFYGLDYYSPSPTHALPSAVAIGGFVALSIHFRRTQPEKLSFFICAVFGVLTAWFEFLNGGAPLGLSIILGTYGIWLHNRISKESSSVSATPAIACALSYLFSFLFSIGLKVFVAFLLAGSEQDYFDELGYRFGDAQSGISHSFLAIYNGIEYISYGIAPLGRTIVAASLTYGVFGLCALWVFRIRQREIGSVILVCLSIVLIAVWYCIFRQHTIIHFWFMARLLVWPIAMSIVIGNWGLGEFLISRRSLPLKK